MNFEPVLHLLRCPNTLDELVQTDNELVCKNHPNIRYPIINGVADFIGKKSDYDEHWKNFSSVPASPTKLKLAKEFITWTRQNVNLPADTKNIETIIDIGCGDGNHISYFPKESLKIAIDYSASVSIVRERYRNIPNLFVIRADAANLPLTSASVDTAVSYSCFNHMDIPADGLVETSRVLKNNGAVAVWGYGTDNAFVYYSFNIVRKLAKILNKIKLDWLLILMLIPFLPFIPSSSRFRLGKNSFSECREIISTNLAPKNIHVLYKWTWKDIAPQELVYQDEYHSKCGQLFRKENTS